MLYISKGRKEKKNCTCMNTHWQGGITEAANMTSESDMNSSATYHADTQTLQVLPPISAAQKKEPKKILHSYY